jgi:hypothetical protein
VRPALRPRGAEAGEALIRVTVGSVLCGVAVVALGVILKPPAPHTDSADTVSRVEPSRISGTVVRDKSPLRAPVESQTQARVDHVRVASLDLRAESAVVIPEADAVVTPGSDVVTPEADAVVTPGSDAVTPEVDAVVTPGSVAVIRESDAATNDQNILEAISVSGWWNEAFDERFPGLATPELPSDVDFLSPSDDDRRTAIYDIAASTVYLPDGRRLEAHSGFGKFIDDPGGVHVKNRGPTPPNVYSLSMRKRLFHGVRAIRLNPIDEDRMFGRDGMLAHSYLHGANGQSNGCVAFKNYPEFLTAFLNGEITRLAVVERLEYPAEPAVASGSPEASEPGGQYASAD